MSLAIRDHLRHDTLRLLEEGGWTRVLEAPQRIVFEDGLSGVRVDFLLFSNGGGRVTAEGGDDQGPRSLDIAPRLVTPNVIRHLL